MNQAAIVLNAQKGFLDPEGSFYLGDAVRAVVPGIRDFLARLREEGAVMVFTQDWHEPEEPCSGCQSDSPDVEIVEELAEFVSVRVRTKAQSAFWATDLDKIIADLDPDPVHLLGVETDRSVLHTAFDLELRFGDREIMLHRDLVASRDPGVHECALRIIEGTMRVKIT